jgi:hypothetical protein
MVWNNLRKNVLRKALLLAGLMALLPLLFACSGSQDSTLAGALKSGKADYSQLVGMFYDYYASDDGDYRHEYELRLLPQMSEGSVADWDSASYWLCHFAPYGQNDEGYLTWSAADLDKAAASLTASMDSVPREDSAFMTYDSAADEFVSTGWDDNGAVYYRLLDPVIWDDDGVYTATFQGYTVSELWQEGMDGGNEAVLLELAAQAGTSPYEFDAEAAIRELFVNGQADNVLSPSEIVTVSFKLSGNDKLPFKYLSCKRTDMDGNLLP